MNDLRKIVWISVGSVVVNSLMAQSAGALSLKVEFNNLTPAIENSGRLRLVSGDSEFITSTLDGDFDIDEVGEFFDLELDGINVGRFGCYSSFGIIDLLGDTSGEGCAFNREFSFVDDFGLNLASLINGDRSLIVNAIFSEEVALSPVGNNLTVVVSYPTAVTPVPTPAVVLPILGGLFSSAYRRSSKSN